jgi:pantothenate kinase
MDGFHYYRSQLDEFEDPEMAHMRRGAYWTFDAKKFISCLRNARRTGCGSFPSFDHSIGDPVEDDIQISESDEVIFIEGLYLLLDIPPWNEVKGLVDLSVFIDCDEETMTQRLCHRHKLAMGLTDEEAFKRASTNDIPNSVEINKSRVHADIILH